MTRAAPADATSRRTPPISRAIAPLIGASSASGALALDGFRAAALRAGFRAAFFGALRAFAIFAFFAIRRFYHGARIRASMTRLIFAVAFMMLAALDRPSAQVSVVGTWKLV